jgi:hypothetical protein
MQPTRPNHDPGQNGGTPMTQRGIVFSKPMVLALLAGIKAQTRRKLKHQPADPNDLPGLAACPYGQPGDRLWVREAWRTLKEHDARQPGELPRDSPLRYEADLHYSHAEFKPGKLRHGIFMPRWASRIELEITHVRLQRLQDISESDVIAEGIQAIYGNTPAEDFLADEEDEDLLGPTDLYRAIWESLHGAGSWESNPWVWVVGFRKI